MSIASVVDADYGTTITTIRNHLGNGTPMTAYEMRLAMAVIKDAISRFSTSNTAVSGQVTVLQGYDTAGEITAATDAVAAAAIAGVITALNAAAISAPTYVTSTNADG